jgi:hypothetical protein
MPHGARHEHGNTRSIPLGTGSTSKHPHVRASYMICCFFGPTKCTFSLCALLHFAFCAMHRFESCCLARRRSKNPPQHCSSVGLAASVVARAADHLPHTFVPRCVMLVPHGWMGFRGSRSSCSEMERELRSSSRFARPHPPRLLTRGRTPGNPAPIKDDGCSTSLALGQLLLNLPNTSLIQGVIKAAERHRPPPPSQARALS